MLAFTLFANLIWYFELFMARALIECLVCTRVQQFSMVAIVYPQLHHASFLLSLFSMSLRNEGHDVYNDSITQVTTPKFSDGGALSASASSRGGRQPINKRRRTRTSCYRSARYIVADALTRASVCVRARYLVHGCGLRDFTTTFLRYAAQWIRGPQEASMAVAAGKH